MAETLKYFKLTIAYQGTQYNGWQRQLHEAGEFPTVQAELYSALYTVLQSKDFRCQASGRTDTGVHAAAQVAHLHCTTKMTAAQIKRALNARLPLDIRIRDCQDAAPEFHAQKSAKKKTYRYFILQEKSGQDGNHSPFLRPLAWYLTFPLDLEIMRQALAICAGEHDFAAFQNQGTELKSTVRKIFLAELIEHASDGKFPWSPYAHQQLLEIRLCGSGFLKQMVRNIVGTVVEVGRGKLSLTDMEKILAEKDRRHPGATAPANGLFLDSVEY